MKCTIRFTLLKWYIAIRFSSKRPLNYAKLTHNEFSHCLVWWRLSILIENWTIECHQVCAECGSSDIGEVSRGDESWTVCQDCRSVEQGYKYVNLREYENV